MTGLKFANLKSSFVMNYWI